MKCPLLMSGHLLVVGEQARPATPCSLEGTDTHCAGLPAGLLLLKALLGMVGSQSAAPSVPTRWLVVPSATGQSPRLPLLPPPSYKNT